MLSVAEVPVTMVSNVGLISMILTEKFAIYGLLEILDFAHRHTHRHTDMLAFLIRYSL